MDIKYRFALSDDNKIVEIFNLTKKDRRDYKCLGCRKVLRLVLGDIRKNTFDIKKTLTVFLKHTFIKWGKYYLKKLIKIY